MKHKEQEEWRLTPFNQDWLNGMVQMGKRLRWEMGSVDGVLITQIPPPPLMSETEEVKRRVCEAFVIPSHFFDPPENND